VTNTTFQELLLTPLNVHEILGFEILSSEKYFCRWEISEILLRVRGLDPCIILPVSKLLESGMAPLVPRDWTPTPRAGVYSSYKTGDKLQKPVTFVKYLEKVSDSSNFS